MHGPFVNINGTSREELIAQTKRIRDAATELREALIAARPHGRDYQTVTSILFEADRSQHETMLGLVDIVVKEYSEVMERLLDDH